MRRLGDPKSLIGALGELPKTPLGAARLASESDLPENRLAEGFHEISLIATGRATQVNWERLRENPAQHGDGGLAARFGSDSARPCPGVWNRAQTPSPGRVVCVLRLGLLARRPVRGGPGPLPVALHPPLGVGFAFHPRRGLLELYIRSPKLTEERCNPLAVAAEAQWLPRERLAPDSVLMELFPRATPYAAALLVAAPRFCPTCRPSRPWQAPKASP